MRVLRSKWFALVSAVIQAFLVFALFVPMAVEGEVFGWLGALFFSFNAVFSALDAYDGFRAARR